MSTPRIYVSDLKSYNEGRLIGEWIDLTEYEDGEEVKERIDELMDKYSEKYHDGEETEFAIHDYEDFDSSLYSESMGEKEFDIIIATNKISEETELSPETLQTIMSENSVESDELEDWVGERFVGKFENDYDIGYEYVETVGGVEGVSDSEMYFDYEGLGRDLSINDYNQIGDNNDYFRNYKKGGKISNYDLSNYKEGGKIKIHKLQTPEKAVKMLEETGLYQDFMSADSESLRYSIFQNAEEIYKKGVFAKGGKTEKSKIMKYKYAKGGVVRLENLELNYNPKTGIITEDDNVDEAYHIRGWQASGPRDWLKFNSNLGEWDKKYKKYDREITYLEEEQDKMFDRESSMKEEEFAKGGKTKEYITEEELDELQKSMSKQGYDKDGKPYGEDNLPFAKGGTTMVRGKGNSKEWKEYQVASDNINHFNRQNEFIEVDGESVANDVTKMPEYKILNKKFKESLKKVKQKGYEKGGMIKYYETEEDRDDGESQVFFGMATNTEDMIGEAKRLYRREGYEAVEVIDSNDNSVIVFDSDNPNGESYAKGGKTMSKLEKLLDDKGVTKSEWSSMSNYERMKLTGKTNYAKGGKVEKKGNEMIIGGLAGLLLGIFLNK